MKVAGAPISWGVCEAPGWGYQLPSERVLQDMKEMGLSATESGPPSFLPADASAAADLLATYGLRMIGGFVPAVLHDRASRKEALAEVEGRAQWLREGGSEVLVLAAETGRDGYEAGEDLNAAQWEALFESLAAAEDIAGRNGLRLTVHPHQGTVIDRKASVERLLEGSDSRLCLDSGHLLIGGTDPLELTRRATDRIGHVHLKDASARLSDQVRSGQMSYSRAVVEGLYTPLGKGQTHVGEIIQLLQASGYDGWYVLEQDLALAGEPSGADDPAVFVRESLEFALAYA